MLPVSGWSDQHSADLARLGSQSITILKEPIQAQLLWDAVRDLLEAPQAEKGRTAGL
jgi:hypothetical protein